MWGRVLDFGEIVVVVLCFDLFTRGAQTLKHDTFLSSVVGLNSGIILLLNKGVHHLLLNFAAECYSLWIVSLSGFPVGCVLWTSWGSLLLGVFDIYQLLLPRRVDVLLLD